MPAQLILNAAQARGGVGHRGVLARGELIDHRPQRGGRAVLCRGDGANLIVGLLQRGRALL